MNSIKELTNARALLNCPENLKFMDQVRSGGVEIYNGQKRDAQGGMKCK
jgi:hypothetical protein